MAQKHLSDAAKAVKRQYAREWRRKNPEKVRENNRKYWEKRAGKEGNGDAEKNI